MTNLVLLLFVRRHAGDGERHAPLVVAALIQNQRVIVIARRVGRQLKGKCAVVARFLFAHAEGRDQLKLNARQRRAGYRHLVARHGLAFGNAGDGQRFGAVRNRAGKRRVVHAFFGSRQRDLITALFFQFQRQRELAA